MKKTFRTSHKKKYIFLFSIIVLVIIIFSLKSSGSPEEKQVLKIALPFDIRSLDIALAHDNNSSHVMNMVFEGLMRRDTNDIPRLAVAKSYEVSSDKKKYIFYLRDCKWSDGKEVTAYDFEFSWKRSLDPSSKFLTQAPYYFYPIKNAKLCLTGKVSIDEVPIHAIDEKTLSVELEYPASYFLDIIALPYFFPLPKYELEKNSKWGTNENVICNGAFKVKSWKKGNIIEVVKNPTYWDHDNVYLDMIEVNIVEDSRTALMMYEKGSLDWIGSPFVKISYDISSDILTNEGQDVLAYWFFINTEKYPLNNKKLRQALSYSIDRRAVVDNIFHSCGIPATSPLSPPLSLKVGGCFQDNNVSLAKDLFEEALKELGLSKEELPEIELSYVVDLEMHHRIAQALQDQWRKVLGIKNISLRKAEWAVHFDRVSKGSYELGFMGWSSCVLDASFILEVFRNKDDASNKSNWENEKYKECLDQANFTINELKRKELLIEAENILMDEMPIIPLCFVNKRFAKNPRLNGENLSSLQFIDFKTAYFQAKQ
jgi:oligopeptide transport system substrate-binding protein